MRAFSVYSILMQLGDVIGALTANIISGVGWRTTLKINGIYGWTASILAFLIITEPSRKETQDEPDEKDAY